MTTQHMALVRLDSVRADCEHPKCTPCGERRAVRNFIATSRNSGKVSREQLAVVADAIERWLDDCWIQEEAPTPRSGAARAIKALGLEIARGE